MAMIHMEIVTNEFGLDAVPVTPFGSVVQEARKRKKFSQGELGYRIGKDQPYISDIERGKNKRPDDWIVRRLAAELELKEKSLFEILGAEVTIGEGISVIVQGLIPADSTRETDEAGATIPEVRVLPEDIRMAQYPDEIYGLQVTGDCMVSIGIHSGDVVIVEPAREIPANGHLVVVRIGTEVSLKRWSMFRKTVELRDGNDNIVWRGAPTEIEVIASYVTFKPVVPR